MLGRSRAPPGVLPVLSAIAPLRTPVALAVSAAAKALGGNPAPPDAAPPPPPQDSGVFLRSKETKA